MLDNITAFDPAKTDLIKVGSLLILTTIKGHLSSEIRSASEVKYKYKSNQKLVIMMFNDLEQHPK